MKIDPIRAAGVFKRVITGSMGLFILAFAHLTPAAGAMPENYTPPEQYTWSAELVDVDAAHNLVTVRSRLAAQREIDESARLEHGENVFLTWSGLRFANAVRSITRNAADAPSALTIPVQFGQLDHDGRYVTFSVAVPPAAAKELASLGAGYWITATSPSYPFDSKEAVVSIRPYNDVE
jgi:hypothetical protein